MQPTVTLDTNALSIVVSPEKYTNYAFIGECLKIKELIYGRKIDIYISQATLGLEVLPLETRIKSFFREWASGKRKIDPPKVHDKSIEPLMKTFELGVKVLRVPRIALGSFVEVPQAHWARDDKVSVEERQSRYDKFILEIGDVSLKELRGIGERLAIKHGVHCPSLSCGWMKGIVAEYDKFEKPEAHKRIEKLFSEWADIDIVASHYAYGMDFLWTEDVARNAGQQSVFSETNRLKLELVYGIKIVSAKQLLALIK